MRGASGPLGALAALVVGVAAIVLLPGAAEARPPASSEELRQKVAAAEAEAADLRRALAAARQRMFEAEGEAARAADRLARIERRLAAGARRTERLNELVDRAADRLARERRRLGRARAILAERLVEIYKAGPTRAGDVAIGAEGFDQLLVGAEYLAAIENADGRLAQRVEQVRDGVDAQAERLRRKLAAAERHEAALAAAHERIGAVSAAADSRAEALRQAAAERDALLSEMLGKLDRWAAEVERAERRERRERRRAEASDSPDGTVERWLGGPYSIPTAIVMCESGGNYSALNPSSGAGGAYQIMPSTWAAYGGKGLPHQAPKAEQDRIAALIWADSGPGAWVCKA